MPETASTQMRELAERFRKRITDPRFGGRGDSQAETYALAMRHAWEMAKQEADWLEAEDA